MEKLYLLLRNNKQTGPHSLTELLELSLKPSDLIWEDGKSTAWKNPQEILALPGKGGGEVIPAATSLESRERQALSPEARPLAVSAAPSPSKKYTFVSLPKGQLQQPMAVITEEPEEDESAKLERKAQEIYNRVQAFASKQQTGKTYKSVKGKDDGETNYTRSLESIKQEYSNWLSQQKKKEKNRFTKKQWVMAASVFCLLFIAAFGAWKGFTGKNTKDTPVAKRATSLPAEKVTATKEDVPVPAETLPENKVMITESLVLQNKGRTEEENRKELVKSQPLPAEKKQADINQKEVREEESPSMLAKTIAIPISQSNETNTQGQEPKEQATIHLPVPKENEVAATPAVVDTKKEKANIPLTQLIHIDGKVQGGGKKEPLKGYEVTVKNNSDKVLKVVAVDVFFYRDTDRMLDKKTLYFSNVKPNQSFTKSITPGVKAQSARFQLGLVSSEGGGIYFTKN